MKVLVTGSNGFIGSAVLRKLNNIDGIKVIGSSRNGTSSSDNSQILISKADFSTYSDWSECLKDVDVLVHTAARVHLIGKTPIDSFSMFRVVNVDGTLELARQAISAGVKRFIFISSIKVNGEITQPFVAFTEDDPANPQDPYSQSKHEAEQGLLQISATSEMELVIIRPPLVYGPGVKANFSALTRAVKNRWPLPLGAIHNLRSLIGLDNLVDFIVTCMSHPKAANQIFLVSDGEDLSTTELLRSIARTSGVPIFLLPLPVWTLKLCAFLIGKSDIAIRLCGNLQIDISKAKSFLSWVPPFSVEEGLLQMIRGAGESQQVSHNNS